MKGPPRAEAATMDTRSISLAPPCCADTCDDCGAEIADWIVTVNGALLCFCCADFWEEVDDEGLGA